MESDVQRQAAGLLDGASRIELGGSICATHHMHRQ
jgi:hypothetical protein